MTPETETRQYRGLDGLPAELLDMIVACIDAPSLAQLASTCRKLSEMLRSLLSKAAKGYALASEEYYSRYLTRNLGAHILDCPFVYRFQRFADTIIFPHQPLADVIEKGKINSVRGFLDAGVSPSSYDELGISMLGLAIGFRHTRIVELLLERGASLELYPLQPQPKMICIIPYCNLESLKLIADKVDLSYICGYGRSVLHQAVRNDDPDVLELLVGKYAHLLSLQDSRGETALFQASQLSDDGDRQNTMIRILVDGGIDINTRNSQNETALHKVSSRGSPEVVQFPLERGIETNIPGKNGMTELHYAARDNSIGVINLLLSHGTFNIHASTNNGETPLHMSARQQTSDNFAALLDNGAILHLRDANGLTPLHMAQILGHWSLERYSQY
ncbi:ankyrin repeat-containing domain protein [Aspergillus parasiticus]|uniref:Ankyrin repeat-containing domain protein n=1 Tax=Aspergillus parasiticus TaxID=5067 RepID=A0A5N6D5G2_ASPPA|nr:ankyrin repeat-containing domain protein [Aspergillus parasiticus]